MERDDQRQHSVGPDRIFEALKGLLHDDQEARQRPAEEVIKELVHGGYLQEES
jgi:hypothetical protein